MSDQIRAAVYHAALALAHHGIKVFPCSWATKVPLLSGSWKDHATNDPTKIQHLFAYQLCNIAISLGPGSGVCDVEPDDEEANRIIEDIMQRSGVRTIAYASRRGNHRLFRWEPELDRWGKANVKAGKLELRLGTGGKGAYSVAPPSLHPDTKEHYAWLPGCDPWHATIAVMPQELKEYFFNNVGVGPAEKSQTEVEVYDDGFLPGIGHRHEYLLKVAKLLRTDLRLPTEVCTDMARVLSQACGSYAEVNRGELELKNLFERLTLSQLPEQTFAQVDFSSAYEIAHEAFTAQYVKKMGGMPDMPNDVFSPQIEAASQHARLAGLPRNLFLAALLTTASFAMGNAVTMQASWEHPPTGLQTYALGVGKAGAGKSRVLKALLQPFAYSDAIITDATAEALTSALARNTRGVLLEVAEGRELPNMLGRYSQGSTSPPVFHKAWSGDRFRVVRQKGPQSIENPFLSIIGAIQPVHLGQFPATDLLDGMLQRMLVFPVGRTPPEDNRESWIHLQAWLRDYSDAIIRLSRLEPGIGRDAVAAVMGTVITGTPPTPKRSILDQAAYTRWKSYTAEKKSDQYLSQWPDDHPFQSDVIRHGEIVLRLSCILYWLDWAFDGNAWMTYQVEQQRTATIGIQYVERAIRLMEFFWHHKQLLMDHLVEHAFAKVDPNRGLSKTVSIPEKLTQYKNERQRRIERHCGDTWTLRDYYRTLGLRKEAAENEVALLINNGRVVAVPDVAPPRFKFVGEPEDVERGPDRD